MSTQGNLFFERLSQLIVIAMLTILLFTLGENKTLALPQRPILDRIGRGVVEGIFNSNSPAQATPPATQADPNIQQEATSFPEFRIVRTIPIPNETAQPNPGPRNTNPIESRIMAMSTKEALQLELDSVRTNYQKWLGDFIAIKTQTRLAQIIHLRANQLGVLLQ